MPDDSALQARYDAIWARGWPAVAAGAIEIDSQLASGNDPRRGMTLIARPGPLLCAAFDGLLDRLLAAAPGQFRQPPADMHLTVLSVFTAAADNAARLARLADYHAAVRAAVRGTPPFAVEFSGLTVSPGAVLAAGYPRGPALEALRARLRAELTARGLDDTLDARYRLVTAHATLLRFVRPLGDPAALAALLARLRREPLGVLQARELELVINDWTMSSATLRRVDRIALPASSA